MHDAEQVAPVDETLDEMEEGRVASMTYGDRRAFDSITEEDFDAVAGIKLKVLV